MNAGVWRHVTAFSRAGTSSKAAETEVGGASRDRSLAVAVSSSQDVPA